jgi:CRP-like cAMP-binding protein
MTKIESALSHFDLFTGLTEDMLAKIANLCRLETYQPDQLIVEHGTSPDKFYLIHEGTVVILTAPEDQPPDLSGAVKITLGTGQSFGEMGLLDSGPRSATVKAVTATTLIVIDCQRLRDLCDTDIELGYPIMKNIAIDLSFKIRYRNLI